MAKTPVDPIIQQFLDLKPVISKIRQLGKLVVFEQSQAHIFGYIINDAAWDQFVILDSNTISDLCGCLITPETYIGFAKDVRKTKTKAERIQTNQSDRILSAFRFSNPGEENELTLTKCDDITLVTKDYNLFMRDPRISKLAVDTALTMWSDDACGWVTAYDIMRLASGESLEISCEYGVMVISRAIFGQMKKTQYLGWKIIDSDEDTFIVLFTQKESDCTIFTLARFLKTDQE